MKIHEKSLLGIRVYGFNTYRNADYINTCPPADVPELVVDTKSAKDSFLDMIFSINPRTKLPDCDVSVFMSKNTSDSVKKFVQDNLLSDNGGVSDTSKYPDLPDSVIADYTRSQGETIYQYRDRIFAMVRKNYNESKKVKDDKS